MFAFRGQISGGRESFGIFADLQVQYLVRVMCGHDN